MAETNIKVSLNAKEFKDQSNKVLSSTKKIEESLGGIAIKATAAFAAFGAGIGLAVKEAGKFERIGVQFEVLTGSVEASEKALKDLTDFSASTPFSFESISQAGAQLLSFGVTADNLVPTLQRIGDVAAASGSDLGEVGLIFGQISAAGKLTGERLLQLQERAIPIGPALAETLGVAEEAVKDLVSQGKVDFETFEKAFNSLSDEGGKAFGGIAKQSQTLEGRLSTLGDNFSLLTADIGNEFLPVVKSVAEALTNLIGNLRNNPETAKFLAQILAVGAAIAGVTAAIATIGIVGTQVFAGLTAVVTGATVVFGALISPIGLVALAIAGIATAAALGFDKTIELAKGFGSSILEILGGVGDIIVGIFTLDTDRIKEGLSEAKDAALDGATDMVDTLMEKEQGQKDEEGAGLWERLFSPSPMKVADRSQRSADAVNESIKAIEEQQKESAAALTAIEQEAEAARVKERQEYLKNYHKFGEDYAMISKFINSERVKSAKTATDNLVALQNSENQTLKTIGKAAAITNITIQTAQSAMAIFKGFSESIPIIGPILGAAAAGAAVVFGAEQIAQVIAARDGGVVPGGGINADTVPAMLAPGELVVPRRNFDEVIQAVGAARGLQTLAQQGQAQPQGAMIRVEYESEEASRIITAQETEDTALGVSRRAFA